MDKSLKALPVEQLLMLLEDCLSRAEYGLRSNKIQYAYGQIKFSLDISNEIKIKTTRDKRLHEMH